MVRTLKRVLILSGAGVSSRSRRTHGRQSAKLEANSDDGARGQGYSADVDPGSGFRLPLPKREEDGL